jgi:acetyl esterase
MDSKLQALLASMQEAGRRPVSDGTPEQARAQLAARKRVPGRALYRIYDGAVPASRRTVPVRVYLPEPDAAGTIVYFHGGGWVMGTLDSFDNVARELAFHSGARVVSVDYSLAPENPYPAALHEAVAAIGWAAEQFPGEPLAVAGDSAGGNLATVAARKIVERNTADIAVQLLMYPVTDSDATRASYLEEPPVPTLLSRAEMNWFWDHYVPDPAARQSGEVSPLRAESLAGMPPTVMILAGHDPLRDEGLAYARRLEDHGVPVELTMFDGMCHGFVGLAGVIEQAGEALRLGGSSVRKHFPGAEGARRSSIVTSATE